MLVVPEGIGSIFVPSGVHVVTPVLKFVEPLYVVTPTLVVPGGTGAVTVVAARAAMCHVANATASATARIAARFTAALHKPN
jgi:hypothetical protein